MHQVYSPQCMCVGGVQLNTASVRTSHRACVQHHGPQVQEVGMCCLPHGRQQA